MPAESKEFKAVCFGRAGESGEACAAVPDGSGLNAVIGGAVIARLPYRAMRVTLTGAKDRYLLFEPESGSNRLRLLVPDPAIAKAIAAIGAPASLVAQLDALLGRRARRVFSRYLAASLVAAALLGLAAAAWLGWESALAKAVDRIPLAWEEELGRASAEKLLQETRICGDPILMQAVREIGMRLVAAAGANPYDIRLQVLDSSEVNAFALPGGYIFVDRGLVEAADDGYEMAGVVAHEMEHLLRRHGLVSALRQVGAGFLFSALFGSSNQIESLLAQGTLDLASLSYSRAQESEADEGALRLLRSASLDPTGMERFLSKLAKLQRGALSLPGILSTHPDPEKRIARLRSLVAGATSSTLKPLETEWPKVRMRCAGESQAQPISRAE